MSEPVDYFKTDKNQLVSCDLNCDIKNENFERVKFLIENVAKINLKNENGDTSLHMQKVEGFKGNRKNLLNYLLLKEIKDKNESSIGLLLSHGADPNYKDKSWKCSLFVHYLRHFEDGNLIDLFVEHGADLKNSLTHQCILHCAIAHDFSTKVFEKLLEIGANVNAVDKDGYAPLHKLVQTLESNPLYDVEILFFKIRLLVDFGANVDALQQRWHESYITPISIAVGLKHVKLIEHLFSLGANPNGHDEKGLLLLYAFVTEAGIDVVKCLIDHGAKVSVNQRNDTDYSLLDYSIIYYKDEQMCCEVVKLLMERGVNFGTTDCTILHKILSKKHLQLFKLLIERGAPIKQIDSSQRSLLLAAVQYNLYEIAEMLIEKGLDVNELVEVNFKEDPMLALSPLRAAIANGNGEMAKLLLKNGAYDADGVALKLACEKGHLDMMKLLIANGVVYDPREEFDRSLMLVAMDKLLPQEVEYLLHSRHDYFCNSPFLVENFDVISRRLGPSYYDLSRKLRPKADIILKYVAVVLLPKICIFSVKENEYEFIIPSSINAEIFKARGGNDYLSELVLMKKCRVHSAYKTTFYDLLTKSNHWVARLLRVNVINEILESFDFESSEFIHYREELKNNYKRGLEVLQKMYDFRIVLQDIFGFILPSDVIYMLSEFYNDHEFATCLSNNGVSMM